MIAIRESQGLAVVQDPKEAYMPYMPLNALHFDDVGGVFLLEDLAGVLTSLARGDRVEPARSSPSRSRRNLCGSVSRSRP